MQGLGEKVELWEWARVMAGCITAALHDIARSQNTFPSLLKAIEDAAHNG